jgi:hypothetical protein
VSLEDRRNRYRISLTDGSAQFLIETVHGLERAGEQVPQLLDKLPPELRSRGHGRVETQYLVPSTLGFPDRVAELAPRLISEKFPSSLSAKLKDFAYLADLELAGEWFQVNIGVVRKNEVPLRVSARVKDPPKVATFCNVALDSWKGIQKASDCTAALDRTLMVGRQIMDGLE